MTLKTKIKTIIPLWGIGLGLCIAILMVSKIWETRPQVTLTQAWANNEASPQVLGDFVDLRGQPLPQPSSPILISTLDDTKISAESFLIADQDTGVIISEKNSEKKEYVASLTKLLTALITYKQTDINSKITVSQKDLFNVSPVLKLKLGDSIKLLDLFGAMIVGSSNDAALALANHTEEISDKNFVEMMNNLALSLGMNNSHFSNPLGFDSPNNYSTAKDLLKLVMETQKFSVFTELGKKTQYEFFSDSNERYVTKATDKLIGKDPEISAIKTGYTKGAGQAMVTKATKNGHNIIIIVLNSSDREGDTLKLKSQIFEKAVWEN